MFNLPHTKRFERDLERPTHSTAIPQDTDMSVESNMGALKGLVSDVIEKSSIVDKEEALRMLLSDGHVQQRFLNNDFMDNEGKPMDPEYFLLARLSEMKDSVSHAVLRPVKPSDMTTSSDGWRSKDE